MFEEQHAEMFEQLKRDHWDHLQDWRPIEEIIDKVAKYFGCSVSEVRQVMGEIQRKYPKRVKQRAPRKWHTVEYKKKCRTCGELIGFARTRDGKMMPVNLHDHTTHWACEKPGGKKK